MKCLIAGASGLVGHELLHFLLSDSRIDAVISIGRRELPLRNSKLRQIVVHDMDRLEDLDLQESIDVAFCCLGTTIKKAGTQEAFRKVDHDYVLKFARYAQNRGARKFCVVSALGANIHSRIFYNRVKGEMEHDLSGLGLESLVIFRPSLLLGHRDEKRWGEGLAIRLYPFYRHLFMGPLAKQRPIEAKQVARAMFAKAFESRAGTQIVLNHDMFNAF